MHPLSGMADLGNWAARNTAYNLTFIPEDKLNWKPEPTANSSIEGVNHLLAVLSSMLPVLQGQDWAPPQFTPATDLASAQSLLTESAGAYCTALTEIPLESLGKVVTVWGVFTAPLARVATMPIVDLVHHHGQIAYIQTLLGDTEMHFAPEG